MKLTYTNGCTCTSLDVDGREFNLDLTHEERKALCRKLIDAVTENDTPLQELFCDFLSTYGVFKDLGRCDCCGDTIYEWTYNLDERC